jgi:myo-inositol-1(or 4)-monophosphatase
MQREMNQLCDAVRKAGGNVLQHMAEDLDLKQKANGDFVTRVDVEVNGILKDFLRKHFPEDGWLSEETQDNPARLAKKRVWIVDPIDGTKELISGIPEFAISVALVEEGLPVLAAVYNPARDEMFSAARGCGVWINGVKIGRSPERPVESSGLSRPERLTILASRSELRDGKFKPFEALAEIRAVGSIAYKLALVAGGKADATFSLDPRNEWDIAAGVLLVQEAGGIVTDRTGSAFVFNRPNTLVNGIVAASADAYARVKALTLVSKPA